MVLTSAHGEVREIDSYQMHDTTTYHRLFNIFGANRFH